ncbi:MAG TPA: hypothetical protein DCW45_09140 [Opitutae bacterium]|nr:hypothetical protein [Opitutae bacterium]|tara:strand:+ start:233 stop:682 length:450 start_codon:yes stop_codon:yes gene_type:complete
MKVYLILIICFVLAAFVFRGHILNFYSPNLTKKDIEQIALEVVKKNFVSDEHIQKIASAVVEKKLEQEIPTTPPNSRLWTSLDGKTIDARLHDADYKSVKLLTPENKLFTVSIERLSLSDRAIIKQFLKSKQEFLDFKPEKPHSEAELK